MSPAINENVIRWSEIRLPHPKVNGQLVRWKVDGPFALRSYYRIAAPGDSKDGRTAFETIRLDLSHRKEDGTIERCLACGAGSLKTRVEAPWLKLGALLLVGLALAPFTFGISLLAVAYPLWFLWSDSPRVQACPACRAEFVDFRYGPRP